MDKFQNATFDSVAIAALAMGINALVNDYKVGVTLIVSGTILSLLKYHFRD